MAWEKHGRRTYYYRSIKVKVEGRVKKVYCGTGVVGLAACEADLRRREQRQAQMVAWLKERANFDAIEAHSRQLRQWCDLLVEAVLLAVGFHRPNRVRWRRWYAAHRAAQASARAGSPHGTSQPGPAGQSW